MQQHLGRGLAAAEAAAVAAGTAQHLPRRAAVDPVATRADLAAAVDVLDEPRVQSLLDTVLAATTIDAALADVIVPYLHELGERWERGETSVAHEHFATTILRGRMLGSRVAGAAALARPHSLLAPQANSTTSRSSRLASRCASVAGESSTSAPTARSTKSHAPPPPQDPAFVVVSAVEPGLFRAISREL